MYNKNYYLLIAVVIYTEICSLSTFSGMHVFAIVWTGILGIFFFSSYYSSSVYELITYNLDLTTTALVIQCTYIWELAIMLNSIIDLLNKLFVIKSSLNCSTIYLFFLEDVNTSINVCRLSYSFSSVLLLLLGKYSKYTAINKYFFTKNSLDLVTI